MSKVQLKDIISPSLLAQHCNPTFLVTTMQFYHVAHRYLDNGEGLQHLHVTLFSISEIQDILPGQGRPYPWQCHSILGITNCFIATSWLLFVSRGKIKSEERCFSHLPIISCFPTGNSLVHSFCTQ